MNKQMFWVGFSIFALEVLAVLGYLLAQLSWTWVNGEIISMALAGLILISLNIFAFIIMIVGAFSND